MTLLDGAYSLDEIAAGRTPDRARLLAGALALDSLRLKGQADRDILDAAAGLELLATGAVLDQSSGWQARTADLAQAVRRAQAHG